MVTIKSKNEFPSIIVGEELLAYEAQSGEIVGLLGSRCRNCNELYFPIVKNCTRCCSDKLEGINLGQNGVLWSWTIQGFLPKEPYSSGETVETFKPYGVGYVEMASGVKIEARLTCADAEILSIGMPMSLKLICYGKCGTGESLYTYAFAPEESA